MIVMNLNAHANYSHVRVRAAIRAGKEEYAVTASSWPIYCYANFSCDAENAEDGLWQSPLLVKVCVTRTLLLIFSDQFPGIQVYIYFAIVCLE